jgi:hypothetical protein
MACPFGRIMRGGLVVRAAICFLKVWACLILVWAAGLPIIAYFASLPPQIGEHVTLAECPLSLPASASDVCFFVPPVLGPLTAYEFDVPEADVRQWAKSRGIDLAPIGQGGVSVLRYLALMPHDPPSSPDDLPVGVIQVQEGLVHSWQCEDQGRLWVYDRSAGRAYVYSHTR